VVEHRAETTVGGMPELRILRARCGLARGRLAQRGDSVPCASTARTRSSFASARENQS
jgi:hypothetical protein